MKGRIVSLVKQEWGGEASVDHAMVTDVVLMEGGSFVVAEKTVFPESSVVRDGEGAVVTG